jgi:hypothetical protein
MMDDNYRQHRGPPGIGVELAVPTGHPLGVTFLMWVSKLFLSLKIIFSRYIS